MRSGTIGELLSRVRDEERSWQLKRQGPDDPRLLPWMPADIAQFLVLLVEAVEHQHGTKYLEVGCGPGTKMLLAREIFGLQVHGVEKDPVMAAAAAQLLGPHWVANADATTWPFYGVPDIIFCNRPCRDWDLENQLESLIYRDMRRGAVAVCMNLNSPPAGWIPVADDWEARRGVWQKP